MLKTPFGNIEVLFDSKPANLLIQKSQTLKDKLYPNIECAYLVSYEYISDYSEHLITCILERDNLNGEIESGEHLDAISFYIDSGKLTLGCKSDFGMPQEGNFDYDGRYLKNGLEIYITSNTKSQLFTFGVSWLKNVTADNEIQTWFASDPSTHQ